MTTVPGGPASTLFKERWVARGTRPARVVEGTFGPWWLGIVSISIGPFHKEPKGDDQDVEVGHSNGNTEDHAPGDNQDRFQKSSHGKKYSALAASSQDGTCR